MDAIESAWRGAGTTVFLRAAAGLGKTSMLAWAKALGRERGFTVAMGVGSQSEARLPFGLCGQVLVGLGGSAVDDAAELASLGGQPARLYRVLRFLLGAAERTPLLLIFDDLHWSDGDSLQLLGFVCRRIGRARILALGALRPSPEEASALADELAESEHAKIVALAPLSRRAAVQLLDLLAPDVHDQHDRVIEACAGSPLLLRAAASALASDASLPPAQGLDRWLFLERFVGFGEPSLAFVRAAAILGVRFKPALAGELAGLAEQSWRAVVAQLLRAGLLEDLGAGWAAFVHPLFAHALTESLQPTERELAHARAFQLSVARGEPDPVAAEHAFAGGLIGDPLAVEVATRAGQHALEQGALSAASELLGGAVELAGGEPAAELLLAYATALAASGQIEHARTVCGELCAHTGADPGIVGRALGLLARAEAVAGAPRDAERLYAEAAAITSERPVIQAEVLSDAALTCHVISSMSWVLDTADRALALRALGEPMRSELRILRAYARSMAGDPAEIALLEREARGWLDTSRRGDQSWAWTRAVHSLNLFKLLEDPAGATIVFEREFPRAVDAGAPVLINALAIAYGDAIHRLGRLHDAYELAQMACAVSGLRMTPWYEVAMSATLTELGRADEAQPYLETLRSIKAHAPPENYAPVSLWVDLIDARLLLAGGDPAAASDAMLDAASVAERSGWRHPLLVPWAGTGIEAHLAAGRVADARSLIAYLERLARPLSCRWPRAVLTIGRAQLAALEGRQCEGERLFAEGISLLSELPFPIERAEALLRYGRYLRRSRRPQAARGPLVQALELAERAGAGRLAGLVSTELAAAGGRRRRNIDRAALTPREQRVAELTATGSSNAQIAAALTVSPKTVDNHLQRIYAKLGIHSRRELMRAAAVYVPPASQPTTSPR